MITLNAIGLDIKHMGKLCIERPYGSGDNLLVIFKSNAIITIDNQEIIAPADSAVVYRTGEKQYYRSICNNYMNHFLHFDCTTTDEFYDFANYPFHRLLILHNISEIEELLRMISREYMSTAHNKEYYIDMLTKILLQKIKDGITEPSLVVSTPHINALNTLRAEIYSNAGSYSSVSELAAKMNLSSSHFQQIYKKHFGVSSYEDLLSAKIKSAQYYLSSTSLSINEISTLCGYENDVCFMRCFKKRTGLTPTEYRNEINRVESR